MIQIPDTSRKPRGFRSPVILVFLAAFFLFAALLSVFLLTRGERFSPGGSISSANVQSVVVSRKETAYPQVDTTFVPGGARSVFVYVALRDVREGARFGAEVERRSRESVVSKLISGGGNLSVSERNVRLSPPSSGETSGTVVFEVRDEGGRTLQPGGYTFRFTVDGKEAARKQFVVG